MIKSLYRDWLSICSIIVSVLCFWLGDLQSIEQDVTPPGIFSILDVPIYNQIADNKGLILWILLVVLALIQIFYYQKRQNEQKLWLRRFLEHITNQHFYGINYDTRISIFRKGMGWRIFIPHLYKEICIKLKNKDHKFRDIPHPFKSYLIVYLRYCSIESPKSYIYFNINDSAVIQSESIVAECFRCGKMISGQTDSIKDLILPIKESDLSRNDRKRVHKYMRDLNISDYNTLTRIKTPSNSLLALPIIHGEKRWGVIAFDNICNAGETPLNFKDKISDELWANYQKIVQFTTQLIK